MRLPTQRKRRTRKEINAVAERYWQSGLWQKIFAKLEGVCVATLTEYLRAPKGTDRARNPPEIGFIRVSV